MGAGRRNQGDYAKSANERLLQVFTRDRAAIYCFVSQNNLNIEIIIKKKKVKALSGGCCISYAKQLDAAFFSVCSQS